MAQRLGALFRTNRPELNSDYRNNGYLLCLRSFRESVLNAEIWIYQLS